MSERRFNVKLRKGGFHLLIPIWFGIVSLCISAPAYQRSTTQSTIHALTPVAIVGSLGADEPAFDFGTARFGEVVTHTFKLRNDGKTPLTIDRIQSPCACLIVPLADGKKQGLPTLRPGETVRLQVSLDTARIPDLVTTPLLSGSQVSKQIFLYVAGQPVHPALVLEMRGRITYGVAFDPPVLDFGKVDAAQGASRIVRVSVDADLYREGRTRLVASDADLLRIVPVDTPSTTQSAATDPNAVGNQVVRSYRVTIPPHAPISLLSGLLTVEGLEPPKLAVKTANITAPAPTRSLAYVGEIIGSASAQPDMVVFGVVHKAGLQGQPLTKAEEIQERTRWILLQCPEAADAVKTQSASRRRTGTKPQKVVSFWQRATVQVDSSYFQAALVPLLPAPADALAAKKSGLPTPPPLPAAHLRPGTACRLRVTLLPSAPHGKPLTGSVTVTLPDKQRLRLPILAEQE